MEHPLRAQAEYVVNAAMKCGAQAAEVLAVRSTELSASMRKGAPEALERAESQALGVRVMVAQPDGTLSSAQLSTSLLDLPSLATRAEEAVAMARMAPADPYIGLAPRELLATTIADYDLYDADEPTLDALLDCCAAMEDRGLSAEAITNSGGAEAGVSQHHSLLLTSDGFVGSMRSSLHSCSLSLIAGEGAQMQRDYAYSTARHRADLRSPEDIADEAIARSRGRLNPRKIPSMRCPVLFEPRVARSLLAQCASAINGAAIARGTSFLRDAMGQDVFARNITVRDDATLRRGLGSRPYDGEGVATTPLTLVEDGVLKHWLLDCRSARQLGLVSNGHAARGLGAAPSPSASNMWIEPGDATPEQLMREIGEGIYISECFGMGVNLITGDYSQGAAGRMIRGGELAEPVSEFTIAGHLRSMFMQLCAANDLRAEGAIFAPSLRIDGMTIAGA